MGSEARTPGSESWFCCFLECDLASRLLSQGLDSYPQGCWEDQMNLYCKCSQLAVAIKIVRRIIVIIMLVCCTLSLVQGFFQIAMYNLLLYFL